MSDISTLHSEVDLEQIDETSSDAYVARDFVENDTYTPSSEIPDESKRRRSHWGAFDKEKMAFPTCPSAITKDYLHEMLIKLADEKADDIIMQSDEKVFAKIGNYFYPVSTRPFTFSEISQILTMMRLDSTPGKVRAGDPQDFAYSVPAGEEGKVRYIRFRVNATACQGLHGTADGISITMRVAESYPKTMDELKVPQGIRDLSFPDAGIIFVTGETGSGKTTILGSMIRHIATQPKGTHIVTFEDPIEYDFRSIPDRRSIIAQTEVGMMIKSFDDSMPNALRRNPGVIMIGEVRSRVSINNAIIAAQSGHAVYTTVHTEGVAVTFSRMTTNLPADERQGKVDALISATRGIIHQRLLTTKDGGRIPVQEWLEFDRDVRDELFGTPLDQLNPTIQKMTEERGRSLLQDLESKKDLIDEIEYRQAIRSLKSAKNNLQESK